jgi:hypothetical protein
VNIVPEYTEDRNDGHVELYVGSTFNEYALFIF